MRSGKELALGEKIISNIKSLNLSGKLLAGARLLLEDDEIQEIQEYANTVSIVRLGFNDHGPVHMRTVAWNAIRMCDLLRGAGIKTNLEKEECGDFEDSLTAIVCASMLHDLGMCTGRQDHELHSVYMAYPILERILPRIYPDDLHKRVIVRSLAMEAIYGHMGNRTVSSLEAGIVQVADGCDMTKGRARIPMALNYSPRAGHIHQFSANSIEEVKIEAGQEKPIRIDVTMSSEVGYFQVEEVLLAKIASSPAKPHIELLAKVNDNPPRQYI